MVESKLRPKNKRAKQIFTLIFCLIFGAGGFAGLWMTILGPAIAAYNTQDWIEATCLVVSSEVEIGTGSEGETTYTPVIRYTYQAGGRSYESTRYDLSPFSARGSNASAAIVARFPPNTRVPCFIDPDEPENALLDRSFFDFTSGIGAFLLVAFAIIPVGVIGGMLRNKRRRKLQPQPEPSISRVETSSGEWRLLRAKTTPKARFLGFFFGGLLLNAFLIPFALSMFEDGEYCGLAFLMPFVAAGMLVLAGAFWKFLALYNPRPVIELSPSIVRVGDTVRIRWRLEGRTQRIQAFELKVIGEEWARYRRGTNTVTVTETFYERVLVQESGPPTKTAGEFTIPASAMHSFEAPNNRIQWRIEINIDIPRWPDVNEGYPIDVRPTGDSP